MTAIRPPLTITEGGGLRSAEFGDIYFQPEDGLAETTHVFLNGNDLPTRFAEMEPGTALTVAELGLGTGLNLLATLALFIRMAKSGARLHFWTCEAFPFSRDDFQHWIARHAERWPELTEAAALIATAYPTPRPGLSQRQMGPCGTLTIWFGDAAIGLARSEFRANGWFLDGFSPAKNPAMWSDDVLRQVTARTAPGGTLATFTVAGTVRRTLTDQGFGIGKKPGFGRKRDMLTASMAPAPSMPTGPSRIAVVGAGIAGAWTAFFARQAGADVTVFDAKGPASGASGNPAGIVMPRMDADDTAMARFYRDAFLFARASYRAITPDFVQDLPARVRLSSDKITHRFAKARSNGLWDPRDIGAADTGSLDLPDCCLVMPGRAIDQLLTGVIIRPHATQRVEAQEGRPVVATCEGSEDFDAVIVTAGPGIAGLWHDLAGDLGGSRGQIDVFAGVAPDHIATDGCYLAPFSGGMIAGATYDRVELATEPQADDTSTRFNRLVAEDLGGSPKSAIQSRASIRTVTSDKAPVCGRMAGGAAVWGIGGLGSRGLSTGPFLAAHVAAQLFGFPDPVEMACRDVFDPARFARRRLRRGDAAQ